MKQDRWGGQIESRRQRSESREQSAESRKQKADSTEGSLFNLRLLFSAA
jgi:ribosomal protein L29